MKLNIVKLKPTLCIKLVHHIHNPLRTNINNFYFIGNTLYWLVADNIVGTISVINLYCKAWETQAIQLRYVVMIPKQPNKVVVGKQEFNINIFNYFRNLVFLSKFEKMLCMQIPLYPFS